MRSKVSAGLLMFRFQNGQLEVFLAHPGGPFFAHRDDGHWTIPKGEIEPGEEFLATALREFKEEVGIDSSVISVLYKQQLHTAAHVIDVAGYGSPINPVSLSSHHRCWLVSSKS